MHSHHYHNQADFYLKSKHAGFENVRVFGSHAIFKVIQKPCILDSKHFVSSSLPVQQDYKAVTTHGQWSEQFNCSRNPVTPKGKRTFTSELKDVRAAL
jgi:hypothetical protein